MTRFSIVALGLCLGLWFKATAGETVSFAQSSAPSLESVISLLETSPTGRQMIEKAVRVWRLNSKKELESRLKWGSASRTDAVLIRHYDAETGKESRERKVTIYLRQDQGLPDLMLDLAHELVHATSNPSWDPYDPELTPGAYIHATIEGEGGEVDAVRVECQVSNEIFGEKSKSPSAARCLRYASASSTDAAEMIRKDFYRVGHWMSDLRRRLGSEEKLFPLLSGSRPSLYSSTGGTPYPVALYEEYRQMTAVACENTRRRSPASSSEQTSFTAPLATLESREKSARLFLAHRCSR